MKNEDPGLLFLQTAVVLRSEMLLNDRCPFTFQHFKMRQTSGFLTRHVCLRVDIVNEGSGQRGDLHHVPLAEPSRPYTAPHLV